MMTEERDLSDKCWDTIKEMASSYQQPRQESEEKEDNTMLLIKAATDEETETNCKLVRDVIESQIEKRKNSSKV